MKLPFFSRQQTEPEMSPASLPHEEPRGDEQVVVCPDDEVSIVDESPAESVTPDDERLSSPDVVDVTEDVAEEVVEAVEPNAPDSILSDTILSELKTLMLQLAKDFEGKLKYDATKQGQIDKLYNETQDYKQGILRKFQQSLILAVVEQIDQASKQITFFENAEFSETTFRKLLNSYQDIATSFQDVLTEKFGVGVYRCEPNTRFDPKRQRTLKTAPTRDAALVKHVKASLRPGYETEDGTIIRPELVEVYIFDETAET